MGRLAEVEAEVTARATTSVGAISAGYTAGCQAMVDIFLNLLNPSISAMQKVMELLDSITQEIDAEYEKFEPLPPLPELPPTPSLELPTINIEDVSCPLAECLGMPALPVMTSIERAAGPPVEPQQSDYQLPNNGGDNVPAYTAALAQWTTDTANYEANVGEFDQAIADYTSQLGTAIASNAEIGVKNALELLENSPQYLLNGLVDAAKASIAALVDNEALEALDDILDCIESKDPAFADAEEIVRYRALRSRIETDSDGKAKIPLSNAVDSAVGDFRAQKTGLDQVLNQAAGMKKAGTGAVEIIDTNPLAKFKKIF